MIKQNPIEVICINTGYSKRLIKGATYVAMSLSTYQRHKKPIIRYVYLKNVGSYNSNNFVLNDDTPLNSIKDFKAFDTVYINTEKDYTGQYVRCRYDYSSPYYKNGEIYLVEKQYGIGKIMKFKIKGNKNIVNHYRFEEISPTELRSLKLKKLDGVEIVTGNETRKFLQYTENEKLTILFEILTKTLYKLINIKIEEFDIVKLMLIEGKNYKIIEDDLTDFLNLNIQNLINNFKNNKL